MKEGNSKKAFDTLKRLTRKQQHKATGIEGLNNSLLTDNAAVLKPSSLAPWRATKDGAAREKKMAR